MSCTPSRDRALRAAFTLIELLVVIAIIALLIGILLPALGKARKAGWLAVSLSNIRQLSAAAYTYQQEQKGYMPLTLTFSRGSAEPNNITGTNSYGGTLEGWCTWQFGGKNCDAWWASAGGFDVEAADRPLNPYIYPTSDFYAPNPPANLPAGDPVRKTLELPVFKDPSDKFSYQRSADFSNNPTAVGTSCYDDVGSTYQFNVKWWDQVKNKFGGGTTGFIKAFKFGCEREKAADAFAPSRFVWINDQYSDVVANNTSTAFRLKNGYDDINKSVMGFLDGHAAYYKVRPGNNTTLNDPNNSYTNKDYTFVFEDLRFN